MELTSAQVSPVIESQSGSAAEASSGCAIIDSLSRWAKETPDKIAWAFLNDKADIADKISYRELDNTTSSLASYLLNHERIERGQRLLLVFFPGLDFTISVIACFKAGIIAVPVFPPDPRKLQKDLHHFISITSNCGARAALCNSSYNYIKKVADIKSLFSSKGVSWPELKWIVTDSIIESGKTTAVPNSSKLVPILSKFDAKSVAFLQYTSGSTSEPKGVMITHGNLNHNEYLIQNAILTDSNTVNISWLPQYHDMGLIGSYLGAVYCGASGYYISPISFLKDPMVWIRAMSKYKGTHTQAPNFAFAFVSRKFREQYVSGSSKISLNLSSMRHIINAAEPVDIAAISAFYEDFVPFGLHPNCIVPTYGLAEHTVYVCSAETHRGAHSVLASDKSFPTHTHSSGVRFISVDKTVLESQGRAVDAVIEPSNTGHALSSSSSGDASNPVPSSRVLVSCGDPLFGSEVLVKIVNPDTSVVLEEDNVGEIWLHSPSVAHGYWGMAEATVHDFHAIPITATTATPNATEPGLSDDGVVEIRDIDHAASHRDGANASSEIHLSLCVPLSVGCTVATDAPSSGCDAEANDSNRAGESTSVLEEQSRKPGYLRTGDLGFLHNGELYICGRLKDLIIVRGTNHYPQDIERSIETSSLGSNTGISPGTSMSALIRPGCSAAFNVTFKGEEERVVFVAEVRENVVSDKSLQEAIIDSCRLTTANEHGISLSSVCLLKPRSIPKTTSGKIARSWCRRAFLADPTTLDIVSRWDNASSSGVVISVADPEAETASASLGKVSSEPSPSLPVPSTTETHADVSMLDNAGDLDFSTDGLAARMEVILADLVSRVGGHLGIPMDRRVPLVSLGLDSMSIIQFKGVLDNKYRCNIPDEFMFTTLATLENIIVAVQNGGLTSDQLAALEAGGGGGGPTTSANASGGGVGNGDTGSGSTSSSASAHVVPESLNSQPCCPWFVCCY